MAGCDIIFIFGNREGYRGGEGRGEAARAGGSPRSMRIVFTRDSHSRIVDGSTGIIVTPVEWASYDTQRRFPPWWFGCSARMGRRALSSRNGGENYKCLIFWLVWPGLFLYRNWQCQRRWAIVFFSFSPISNQLKRVIVFLKIWSGYSFFVIALRAVKIILITEIKKHKVSYISSLF